MTSILDRLLELKRKFYSLDGTVPQYLEILDEIQSLKSEIEKAIEDSKLFHYWKETIQKELGLVNGEEFTRFIGIYEESQKWLKNKDRLKELEQNQKTINDEKNQEIMDRLKEVKYNDMTYEKVASILGGEK